MNDIEMLEQIWEDELDRYDNISRLCKAKDIPVRDFLMCMMFDDLRRIADTLESSRED